MYGLKGLTIPSDLNFPANISSASTAAVLGLTPNNLPIALNNLLNNLCSLLGFFLTILAPSKPIAVANTSLSSISPCNSGYACSTCLYNSVSLNSAIA